MALSTNTELKASIADWLNRGDLTAQIPDFIRLAETEFNRREEIVDEKSDAITLQASPVVLPTDCQVVTGLFYDDILARGPIELCTPALLAERKAAFAQSGRPVFAAVNKNGTEMRLGPIPDQAYVARIEYETKLVGLATTATNWLLTDHPDIYLFGALMQAAPFLKDDARIGTWEAKLEKAFAQLKRLNERRKFAAAPLVWRPRRPIG